MFTTLIKSEGDSCFVCGRPEVGYFGNAYKLVKRGSVLVHVRPLCMYCFQVDAACAEADAIGLRYTRIGVGIDGISCYEGYRCPCGAVRHANLGYCIQCSKNQRMLGKIQAEKKFIDKLLKNLRAEIKSKAKELENGN